ncbi:MAG: type II toxin-antitoxin system VapC family toxin, partial [Candidatus Nitrosotenuis sp.]
DDCNRKTRLCVGSAKTRLMATDETEKQQKQNPEPFRVGSVSVKSGTIGDRDLFISSISLANRQVLLTKNKKHFERVPGLRVETW